MADVVDLAPKGNREGYVRALAEKLAIAYVQSGAGVSDPEVFATRTYEIAEAIVYHGREKPESGGE